MRDGYCARCGRWVLRQWSPDEDSNWNGKWIWVHADIVYKDGEPDVIDPANKTTCGGEPIRVHMPPRWKSNHMRDSQIEGLCVGEGEYP